MLIIAERSIGSQKPGRKPSYLAQCEGFFARPCSMRARSISFRNWEGNLRIWGNAKVSFPFSASRGRPGCESVSRSSARAPGRPGGQSMSRPTSSDRAECVSQPSDIESTPVSATARTFASVMPPDASVWQRCPTRLTAAPQLVGRHVVEQHRRDAAVERLVELLERVDLDLHRKAPAEGRACAADRGADRAGDADVVVLDQDGVIQPDAVIDAAADRRPRTSRACAGPASSCACP